MGCSAPRSASIDRQTAASGPALSVNAAVGQRPIDPMIYGMNFADPALLQQLQLPVNRWGGNATTRYSWQNDMANHASDWYFENIPGEPRTPASCPTTRRPTALWRRIRPAAQPPC